MTTPARSDFDLQIPDPGGSAYLVIDPAGGPVAWGGTDRGRAYELARNTGRKVAWVQLVTDDPEEAK